MKREPVPSHQKNWRRSRGETQGQNVREHIRGGKKDRVEVQHGGKDSKKCPRCYGKVLKAQEKDMSGVRWVPHNGALAVCASTGDINGGFVLLKWVSDEKKKKDEILASCFSSILFYTNSLDRLNNLTPNWAQHSKNPELFCL